jgi:hypothetical protein
VDGKLEIHSHKAEIIPGSEGMFQKAVEVIESLKIPEGMVCYGEFFAKPKQNTLAYKRVPKNNIAIFDILYNGAWLTHAELEIWADGLELDVVPLLHEGRADVEMCRGFLGRESYLGGPAIEGVVIKAHNRFWQVGPMVWPIFCKYVDTAFKERNQANWTGESKKSKLDSLMDSLATEARWRKAVQHLKEKGELRGAVQDIGPLMKEVALDFEAEEKDWFIEQVWEIMRKDALRRVQSGMPNWYKEQLTHD